MANDKQSKITSETTTVVGIYSSRYKGGPVIKTKDNHLYLLNFPEDDKYEGKTLQVVGKIEEDNEHVVKPYEKGEIVSQGWASPRTVIKVVSFKVIK